MSSTRYRLDASVQRFGTTLVGGSPLTLFRVTDSGREIIFSDKDLHLLFYRFIAHGFSNLACQWNVWLTPSRNHTPIKSCIIQKPQNRAKQNSVRTADS